MTHVSEQRFGYLKYTAPNNKRNCFQVTAMLRLYQLPLRAAGKLRKSLGLDPSGNASGPLHDLPDWRYAGMFFTD